MWPMFECLPSSHFTAEEAPSSQSWCAHSSLQDHIAKIDTKMLPKVLPKILLIYCHRSCKNIAKVIEYELDSQFNGSTEWCFMHIYSMLCTQTYAMLCTQTYDFLCMLCHAKHTNRAPPPTIPSLQGWHWEVERQFRHRRGTITTLSHCHHNHYQNITTLSSHCPSFAFTRHSQKHLNSMGCMRSLP